MEEMQHGVLEFQHRDIESVGWPRATIRWLCDCTFIYIYIYIQTYVFMHMFTTYNECCEPLAIRQSNHSRFLEGNSAFRAYFVPGENSNPMVPRGIQSWPEVEAVKYRTGYAPKRYVSYLLGFCQVCSVETSGGRRKVRNFMRNVQLVGLSSNSSSAHTRSSSKHTPVTDVTGA